MGNTIHSVCKFLFGIHNEKGEKGNDDTKETLSYDPPIAPRKKTVNHIKNTLSNDFETKENNKIDQTPRFPRLSTKALFSVDINITDFEKIKILGKGSFGKVLLVRYKRNNELYALKILQKEMIRRKQQISHTKTERIILEKMQNPFIVSLKYAFQTEENLYLVTDFLQGGELCYHLRKEKRFSEPKMKFYVCQIILAIEHLHKNNIIYRDLKPENILFDKEGNIKVTDFGLSKIINNENNRAYTICGTPEYLAPEILMQKGYDKSVDWWSLGALVYEMLVGVSPFKTKNNKLINIGTYLKNVEIPVGISEAAGSLIRGLLQVETQKRLGYGERDAEDVKQHCFFKEINWENVFEKKIKQPFKPRLINELDLSYFDKRFTAEKNIDSISDQEQLSFVDNYDRFTFVMNKGGESN
jgi:serine/threonine protein kinase